jgi:hypothetical protein
MASRPLTNISEGFAQVLDTSGLVQALYEDRENKRKRFEKNVKSFDPSSVWYRDIPEFSKKVNEYYADIAENYDAYANKSRNIEKWQELKNRENEMLNFIASSKAMQQTVKQAQNLMLNKPETYDTPENQQLIDDIITGKKWGGLSEGYKTGEAMNNTFLKEFGRNIFVDVEGMNEVLEDLGETDFDAPETGMIAKGIMNVRYPKQYDPEAVGAKITDWWENGFASPRGKVSGRDIQKKYDNIQDFAEAVQTGLPQFTEPKERRLPTDTEKGDLGIPKFVVEPSDTTYGATASHTGVETVKRGGIPGALGGTREQAVQQPVVYDVYSQGGVKTGGTQNVYKTRPGAISGWDMKGDVWSTVRAQDIPKMALGGVEKSFQTKDNISFNEITLKDAQGNDQVVKNYVAKKGGLLSPEMVEAIKAGKASVIDEDGNQIVLNSNNALKYLNQDEFAFVRGGTDVSGYELADPTSFGGIGTEKQYHSIAMLWEDFKAQVQIPPSHQKEIEDGLGRYENVESPFATSLSGPATDFDQSSAEEKAASFVNQWIETQ